jgi:uncharacterized protein YfaQ (DUF2300 family)
MVGLIGAAASLVAGCGESRHANDQRPQASTRVSVTIDSQGLTVQPTRVAFGPEKSQQIPQNQNQSQPPRKTREPLNVVFVIANNTDRDATVQIRHGSQQVKGAKVLAHSPETVGAELPTGTYTVSATGATARGQISVGSYRASSQNDVLLP